MSESKEHFYRDFSKFDEMSTEELNEILRQDSQLPDGEDSDTDAILYRDEQNRRKEQPANTVNGNQKSFGHLKGAKTIAR